MIYEDISHWDESARVPGLIFFAQRLQELTFQYTMDSNRAPTTNISSLVKEAIREIERVQGTGTGHTVVGHILDELTVKLHNNPVVSALANIPANEWLNLDYKSPTELLRRLNILAKEVSPYSYINTVMRQLIEAVDDGKKKSIDFLLRELVSSLTNIGMAPLHIYEQTVSFFFSDENKLIGPVELAKFFLLIFPHLHSFDICFLIKSVATSLHEESIGLFKLEILDELPRKFEDVAKGSEFARVNNRQKYARFQDVMAYDAHSAIAKAENRISHLHDSFFVFHHKESFSISSSALVSQCCVDGERKVRRAANRMTFVDDNRPSVASRKLNRMLRSCRIPAGPDRSKFFRSVEFHGMAVRATALENQLLNIWISMETLTPQRPNKTIIDGVAKGLLPFTGLTYFDRLLSRLAADIRRWDKVEFKRICSDLEHVPFTSQAIPMARLLLLSENEKLLEELFNKMGSFELLRFRAFQLRERLRNPKRCHEALSSHQRRVDWQIRRIYRTRNSIVHSGDTPLYTGMLTENAHDYFDGMFAIVCDLGTGDTGFDTLEECFDFAEWKYNDYSSHLKSLEAFNEKNICDLIWQRKKPPGREDVLGLRAGIRKAPSGAATGT